MFCYTLTISVNAYDQYGEYLLVVFKDIPSLEELSESLVGGGVGRINKEDYTSLISNGFCNVGTDTLYLTKVEFGKLYQNID